RHSHLIIPPFFAPLVLFFFHDPATPEIYTLSLHDALPISVAEVLDEVELVLCMTVNPGWGGQPFIPQSLDKLRRLKAVVGEKAEIEVDGGVDLETIGPCAQAGASVFVAGSAVFGNDDPARAVRELSTAASGG